VIRYFLVSRCADLQAGRLVVEVPKVKLLPSTQMKHPKLRKTIESDDEEPTTMNDDREEPEEPSRKRRKVEPGNGKGDLGWWEKEFDRLRLEALDSSTELQKAMTIDSAAQTAIVRHLRVMPGRGKWM
jgi:hypothetical protein